MRLFARLRIGNSENIFNTARYLRLHMRFHLRHVDTKGSLSVARSHSWRVKNLKRSLCLRVALVREWPDRYFLRRRHRRHAGYIKKPLKTGNMDIAGVIRDMKRYILILPAQGACHPS